MIFPLFQVSYFCTALHFTVAIIIIKLLPHVWEILMH